MFGVNKKGTAPSSSSPLLKEAVSLYSYKKIVQ